MPAKDRFNRLIDGKQVAVYELQNDLNTKLCITNYGCRIVSLLVPNKNGQPVDVVVGFDSIDGYLTATEVYHGATIGRYSNRIARGSFKLNDKEYKLAVNNEPNHLHGGPSGFHTRVWDVEEVNTDSITLSYLSEDGEEGYPGNLNTKVKFSLTAKNEVVIDYEASTDGTTILNLTNHAYFNLNGQGSGTILHHLLQINADRYTPVDKTLIPTGEFAPVSQSPFDFTSPATIGKRINEDNIQLQYGNGYDHNYVINKKDKEVGFAAKAIGDKTGLVMELFTSEPGVQFYTGNFMSGENLIKGHVPDHFRTAFCLETQHFPDAPNQPNFPSTELKPEDVFRSTTIYKFSTGE
jgi:aldose 1-epimerase